MKNMAGIPGRPGVQANELFSALCRQASASRLEPAAQIAAAQDLFRAIAEGRQAIPERIVRDLQRSMHIARANLMTGLKTTLRGLARPLPERALPDRSVRKPPRVAIIAAGNIPGVAVAPALLLAAAGCPVVVKQSRHDRVWLPWLLEKIQAAHPGVMASIYAGHWPAGSKPLREVLRSADSILAFGATATVRELQHEFPRRVLGFGHKFSIAYAEVAAFDDEALQRLALDVALFSQQGCLSVQAIFVRGNRDEVRRFSERFCEILAHTFSRLGGCTSSPAHRLRLQGLLDVLDMTEGEYWRRHNSSCCAVLMPHFNPEWLLGRGVVQIVPVARVETIFIQLAPHRQYLQGAALCTSSGRESRLANQLHRAGFSLVCRPGELQAPPLDWANSGVRLPDAVLAPSGTIWRKDA